MTEPLDLTPIEARILPGSTASIYSRPQMWDDALALLAEVNRLRAQLAEAREYAADLIATAPALLNDTYARVWDDGYRNGYSIGFRDDPAALTNYQNPYREAP